MSSSSTATPTALHIPWHVRLFSSPLQAVLFLAPFALPATGWVLINNPTQFAAYWHTVLSLLATLLWLRGLTGWAHVDDDGLRWRYWATWDHPWNKIGKITLTRRRNPMNNRGRTLAPIILIRDKGGDEEWIRPALRCRRHRRDFATALLQAAQEHGVRTEVVSEGWNEKPTRIAEPFD